MMTDRRLKPLLIALAAAGCLATATAPATAGERESLEQLRTTTLSLIELLVQEGVLSKDKAQAIVQQAESAKVASQANEASGTTEEAGSGKTVRVQYVPEHVKKQLRDEIREEVMAKAQSEGWATPGSLPDWLDRIAWEGDLRLRYEMNSFPEGNADVLTLNDFYDQDPGNTSIANSTEDRNRFRVRARLGAKMRLADWLDAGIRMTTGNDADPVSPNQTLETQSSKYSFALDRAYLRMTPTSWATVSGGRIENPYFSTDLVWDPDLAFDGVAASFKPKLGERITAFGTLGAFSLDEQEKSEFNKARDKWMLGGQAGLQWTASGGSSVKFAAALYDFKNVEGTSNPLQSFEFSNTGLSFRNKGNHMFDIDALDVAVNDPDFDEGSCDEGGPCGIASKFREFNLTGQVDLAMFNPVHVILTADYVRNLGFDKQEILRRTGLTLEQENEGYQVSLTVGMPKVEKRHDWQVFGSYKRLEADAVLDAFTDSDFRLGGTDSKGWILGANYGLDKNTWLSARWLSADEISGPPLGIDVLLVDLNAKF